MAFWPSVSIKATSMLQPWRASAEPTSYKSPGRSWVTTSISVEWSDEPSSNWMEVRNVTLGGLTTAAARRPFSKGSSGCLPFTTSAMLCWKRARSLGFNSSVWCMSTKWNVSSTTPAEFAKASAFTMFMPQAARAPEIAAKSAGRSADKSVSSKAWCRSFNSVCTGCTPSFWYSAKCSATSSGEWTARYRRGKPSRKRSTSSFEAVAVHGAAEIVGSGHEQLPEHFRFPGSQRFRIHGVNIGVSEQAKALQALLAADDGGESGNGGGIENVAALDG